MYNIKVKQVEFDETGVRVHFNTCTTGGKRDHKGFCVLPAGDVTQYTLGEVYELSLRLIEVAEQIETEVA